MNLLNFRGGGYTMNSTNETKMDMKQAKQNNTPNIRWTLVRYDLIVYALVAVILLVLYGGMDKLSTVGIFQQVGLSVLCIFTARLMVKTLRASMESMWDSVLYPLAVY